MDGDNENRKAEYFAIDNLSKDFCTYFIKNWMPCEHLWAQYYRKDKLSLGTNTNNHIESFNNNTFNNIII